MTSDLVQPWIRSSPVAIHDVTAAIPLISQHPDCGLDLDARSHTSP